MTLPCELVYVGQIRSPIANPKRKPLLLRHIKSKLDMCLYAGMSLFPGVRTDCIPAVTSHIVRCACMVEYSREPGHIRANSLWLWWNCVDFIYKVTLDQCWSQVFLRINIRQWFREAIQRLFVLHQHNKCVLAMFMYVLETVHDHVI